MALRCQCSWRAFFFGGEDPKRFAFPLARWPFLPMSFLAYRWVLALYQLIVFILALEHWCLLCYGGAWLIYITDWSLILLTLYTTWSALATTYLHLRGKEIDNVPSSKNYGGTSRALSTTAELDMADSTDATHVAYVTPWYFKVNWCLQVLACSAEFAVSVLYWIILYKPGETTVTFFNVSEHGIGMVLLIVDFFIVANPSRFLHFVYPSLYAGTYFLFTYIYYIAGGRNPDRGTAIYVGALDWEELPTDTLILAILSTLVAAPVSHVVFFLIHLLKIGFAKCCSCCRFWPR